MVELDQLPTTESGHIRKRQAMKWIEGLDEPSEGELKDTVIPKPSGFSGSKYPTEISTVRITGTPEFIEAVGASLKPLLDFEDNSTRVEINLQRTEDKDTGELTDNYALYLSIAERG
ncbi:uncharacterized protein Hqrw_5063 (plasmid) [Haloquadratum walsbyi C23]|uniref:Uncharacterized protein n=2 Tax=Haloquadratum walsbyi TaxID=293091 RepID=G0LND0_HALWC|nr:uncharacterized protein Hqrw_5063 [Haloquadratum walsbyi C23]